MGCDAILWRCTTRPISPQNGWTATLSGNERVIDAFHSGMMQRKSAMMHMGRCGLSGCAVPACTRHGAGGRLEMSRIAVTAGHLLLATGAYTRDAFPWCRGLIVPVGSVIIATRAVRARDRGKPAGRPDLCKFDKHRQLFPPDAGLPADLG